MATSKPTSDRLNALERRMAKLEAQSQPLGQACPKCHAFGFESYVPQTIFDGKGLRMMRCRFCNFAEEEWVTSARSAPLKRDRIKGRESQSTPEQKNENDNKQ
jgi:hypothetical protein